MTFEHGGGPDSVCPRSERRSTASQRAISRLGNNCSVCSVSTGMRFNVIAAGYSETVSRLRRGFLGYGQWSIELA